MVRLDVCSSLRDFFFKEHNKKRGGESQPNENQQRAMYLPGFRFFFVVAVLHRFGSDGFGLRKKPVYKLLKFNVSTSSRAEN